MILLYFANSLIKQNLRPDMENDIQIFLSYASQDQERVLSVYEFLIKNGFPNTWIDCKKLLPGQPWEFEIQRNLKKSEIVIFFFLTHR